MLWWGLALMAGPEAYASMNSFMGSFIGQALVIFSTACICYHLMNGIRHLVWDTGIMLGIEEIYRSGNLMMIAAAILFLLTLWISS